jgi:hypothetical protein
LKNELYEIELSGCDLDGKPIFGTVHYPAYTCGHCSNIIVLRADRSRERKTCMACMRWICEKSQICNSHCTPIHALANDHFEGAGEFGRYIPAIMAGVSKIDEAQEKGLVTLS